MNNLHRQLALKVLSNIYDGMLLNIALDKFIYKKEELKPEYRYVLTLVKGTIENKELIDSIVLKFLRGRTKKELKILIELATFELKFLDSSKGYAVVNEYVDLVKKSKFKANYKFVNAILRNIENTKIEKHKNFPEWLKELLVKEYSKKDLQKIIDYNFSGINCRIIDESVLEDIGHFKYTKRFNNEIKISNIKDVKNVDIFKDSRLIIQDHGSILVGEIAKNILKDIKSPLILDMCAAPGSKTIHLSEIRNSNIIASDISPKRLIKLSQNIKKYNRSNIDIKVMDATIFNKEYINKFDLVLCDLPCSGIGLIAKKPDILLNMSLKKINDLKKLQLQILENAIQYVSKGGYLICSTCTIIKDENMNIFNYLDKRLNNIQIESKDYIQLLQGIDDCDGFFISVFKNE